jgi:MarR family transcriptional regulator, transcriptional regulator for hemolysin
LALAKHKPAYYVPDMEFSADDLLIVIHDLARAIRTDADRRAREHGMTRAQWLILAQLSRKPGLSQRELAEIAEVEPITIARIVDRLESRGLVERRPDAADRRIWRLHLLPAAEAVLAKLGGQREAILNVATEGVDPTVLTTTIAALRRMKSNMLAGRRHHAPAAEEEKSE